MSASAAGRVLVEVYGVGAGWIFEIDLDSGATLRPPGRAPLEPARLAWLRRAASEAQSHGDFSRRTSQFTNGETRFTITQGGRQTRQIFIDEGGRLAEPFESILHLAGGWD